VAAAPIRCTRAKGFYVVDVIVVGRSFSVRPLWQVNFQMVCHSAVLGLSVFLATPLAAAEGAPSESPATEPVPVDRGQRAMTDPADVDADFAYQGEFTDAANVAARGTWGLQVVALGDGRLDAVLLRGGLPGAGWDGHAKYRLTGQRGTEWATLEGDGYRVKLTPTEAVVSTAENATGTTLPRVHRVSPTQDAPPPPAATVLFDGRSTDQLLQARVTPDGLLEVGAVTKAPLRDFHMHAEFRTPYMPFARGQGRGNSGIYIQQRYEVQILDSFGLEGVENECGGIYKQRAPDVNMCLPPLSWQTYDIYFTAARWDRCGRKASRARITVVHNGVTIHDDYAIRAKTGAGKAEDWTALPTLFQNHNNPVRFRNVWVEPYEPAARVQYAAQVCRADARGKLLRACLSRHGLLRFRRR
jgi:hypothetical protein